MADERVNTFADRLFEAGLRFPESTRAVIVFKEYLAATDPIPPTDGDREALAQAEAERRWPIHPHGVTDTRDVPDLLRNRACFVQGAVWAAGIAAREVENG